MKRLRNISINARLKITYVLIGLIPLLLFATIEYRRVQDYADEFDYRYISQSTDYINDVLTKRNEDFSEDMSVMLYSSEFKKALIDIFNSKISFSEFRSSLIKNIHFCIQTPITWIDSVRVYDLETNKSISLNVNQNIHFDSNKLDFRNFEEYHNASQYNGKMYFHVKKYEGKNVLLASRKLYKKSNNKIVNAGYITFILNDNYFRDLIKDDFKGNYEIYIDDEKIFSYNGIEFSQDMVNKRFKSKGSNLEIFSFIKQESIEKNFLDAENIIIIALILIVISFLVDTIFSETIIQPLKLLKLASKRVANGDFDIRINEVGNDEITEVVNSFNIMVVKLKQLIYENYEIKISEKDYEYKFLQAQINPHFLNNTLETLRYKSINEKNHELANEIFKLSQMFREILTEHKYYTLEKEIEYINMYIHFQKENYGDNMIVNYDIQKGIESCLVVKFMIQIIVENSLIHGWREKNKLFYIDIRAYKEDEFLIVEIKDNGVGTNQIIDLNKRNCSEHIGLYNLSRRIKQKYGKECGIKFVSKENLGTMVTIRVKYQGVEIYEDSYCG